MRIGELALHPLVAMWWHEQWKDVLPLSLAVGERADTAADQLQHFGEQMGTVHIYLFYFCFQVYFIRY